MRERDDAFEESNQKWQNVAKDLQVRASLQYGLRSQGGNKPRLGCISSSVNTICKSKSQCLVMLRFALSPFEQIRLREAQQRSPTPDLQRDRLLLLGESSILLAQHKNGRQRSRRESSQQ